MMTKRKRNIGLEILEGLREIRKGKHGRMINIPGIAEIRKKTGLSQAHFAQLLARTAASAFRQDSHTQ